MKRFLLIVFLVTGLQSQEHPSWGIVVDNNGLIYFVDVMHHDGTLWQYHPKSGELTALVKGHFHAHGLQIVGRYLYIPTHIWIDGEIMGDGQNYLFRYNLENGQLDTLLYHTSYDNFYGGNAVMNAVLHEAWYVHKKKVYAVNIKTNQRELILSHSFERFTSMSFDKYGFLWMADAYANGGCLWKWSRSKGLSLYAQNLIPEHPENPPYREKSHQLIYGIGFSEKGNPVICESAGRQVKEVYPSGKTKVIYQSPEHFFPVGVYYFDRKYYIMEIGFISGKGHIGPYIITVAGNKFIRDELRY